MLLGHANPGSIDDTPRRIWPRFQAAISSHGDRCPVSHGRSFWNIHLLLHDLQKVSARYRLLKWRTRGSRTLGRFSSQALRARNSEKAFRTSLESGVYFERISCNKDYRTFPGRIFTAFTREPFMTNFS